MNRDSIAKIISRLPKILALLLGSFLVVILFSVAVSYAEKYTQESDSNAYQKYKDTVRIGVNVDYDRLGYAGERIIKKYNLGVDDQKFWNQDQQLELIKELYNLGLREFRLNFRWRDLSPNGTDIDLSKINKILTFFEQTPDISLNLCFGPYKNFSYPEQYVQRDVASKYLQTKSVNYIHESDQIYIISKEYLTNLLEKVSKDYPSIINKTKSFQANNEPFHPFGTIPISSTYDTEYQLIKLVENYFPNARLTFNTPLFSLPKRFDQVLLPDIEDAQLFIQYLEKKDPELVYKLTLGINYYANIGDGLQHTPFSAIDSITSTKFLAFFTRRPTLEQFNTFLGNTAKKYRREDSGFDIKIAELQEETWNGEFAGDEPGKSLAISKKNVTRILSYQNSFMPEMDAKIDLWGAEQMAVYAYLNRTLTEKPENFVNNANKNMEVVKYYLNEF